MSERIQEPTRRGRPRLGAIIAIVIAVAFLAWLIFKDGDDEGGTSKGRGPFAASIQDLRDLAQSTKQQVYWAGPKEGYTYELTETADGSVYIRYLPPKVPIGVPRPRYTTIGSYLNQNAFATMEDAATREGAFTRKITNGGLAVSNRGLPTSVFFAYPNSNTLIEVFDRRPRRARELATTGKVTPLR